MLHTVYRPSDFTVSEDAEIEPNTGAHFKPDTVKKIKNEKYPNSDEKKHIPYHYFFTQPSLVKHFR
jgi:hypothetical protein